MRSFNEYSAEYIERLKEFYVNNPISLDELASGSQDEFGIEIDLRSLKFLAFKGRWGVLKRRTAHDKEGLPDSIVEEINDLREALYDAIMDAENPPPPRDMSSMISSYMNLQSVGATKIGSAKTSLQQVLDTAEEVFYGRRKDTSDD